jgi:hypothetical protein
MNCSCAAASVQSGFSDHQVVLKAPANRVMKRRESVFVAGAILGPHLLFVDRQAYVVESEICDVSDIVLDDKLSARRAGAPGLGKPVRKVGAFTKDHWRVLLFGRACQRAQRDKDQ